MRIEMNRGRMWRAALAVVVACAATPAQAANLVSNGSFELPGFDPECSGTSCPTNYRYLTDGDTRIAGWTITRTQSESEAPYWFHTSRYAVFEGDFALALTDGSQASTSVAVEAGSLYRVRFVAFRDLNPPVGDFALSVRLGTSEITVLPSAATDTGVPGDDEQNWLLYDVSLRASVTGEATLAIENVPEGITTPDGGIIIDAVEVDTAGAGACDVDGDGRVSVTDGVNVLRAAAGLPSTCGSGDAGPCDVDGDGRVSVTDGVNVLRAAAGLASTCTSD